MDGTSPKIPAHVAIIMDGNGRWAEKKGLPRSEGHKAGAEPVRTVLTAAVKMGIKNLTLYTFSTENWGRPEEEINSLFALLGKYLRSDTPELHEKGVRLAIVGDLRRLPGDILKSLNDSVDLMKDNMTMTLTLALSYGARAELVAASKSLCRGIEDGTLTPDDITEESFSKALWTSSLPDVDFLIRTGGDKRISNFLLWKIAYAELYFTDVQWPDFTEKDFLEAVDCYQKRDRRFGKA
ncbi:MAG: isoprenyl transferase [Deltaproteobacteria bacterium]|jgi:undecaprenyl diphosphate synthase|nr:isoprenyl transferase [Deltaproteobacteria bacterium]